MWNATTTAAVAMSHLEIKDTLAEIAAWSAANDGQLDIKIGSKRGGKSRQSSVMIKVTVTAQNKSVRSWNVIGELGMRSAPMLNSACKMPWVSCLLSGVLLLADACAAQLLPDLDRQHR